MGNKQSNTNPLTTEAIEAMYANRALAASDASKLKKKAPGSSSDTSSATSDTSEEDLNIVEPSEEDPFIPNNSEEDSEGPTNPEQHREHGDSIEYNKSGANQRTAEVLRKSLPRNSAVSAAQYITHAVNSYHGKAADAFERAIAELRKMRIIDVAKTLGQWIKAHPWETAAIVVPLIMMACTPAILGAVGFTAGGVAAGSVAAGIQAGIGNVVAGSLFATCTSAMMGGGGLAIVLGVPWLIGTSIFGGVALWKRWVGDGDAGDEDSGSSTEALPRRL